MADVFNREQAGRLFGCIAAGLSIGGLLGPVLAGLLARALGSINLLLVAVALLLASGWLMRGVIRWNHRQLDAAANEQGVLAESRERTLQGSPFAAFSQVARIPYLRGVAVFVLLLTAVSTVLYLQQQRVVADTISDPDARTALFAQIDFAVQLFSLMAQMLLFSRLLRRFGFTAMLVSVPALLLLGFALMSLGMTMQIVVAAMVLRRIGEYAVTRPCRDMLMSVVSREQKYQAKSLIDTFVYRGGDALSASALAGLTAVAANPGAVTVWAGIALCTSWVVCAARLGGQFEKRAALNAVEGAGAPVGAPTAVMGRSIGFRGHQPAHVR
jgi:ATP:ADP antiporter, AAA family